MSDGVELAQELLNRVEEECASVGLRLNSKKTEVTWLRFRLSQDGQLAAVPVGTGSTQDSRK